MAEPTLSEPLDERMELTLASLADRLALEVNDDPHLLLDRLHLRDIHQRLRSVSARILQLSSLKLCK